MVIPISDYIIFNLKISLLCWQTYAHKILTGRRNLIHTVRRNNDVSGSTSRPESEYDPFGAGHGCNSVSAGLGRIYSHMFPVYFFL